MGLLTGRAGRAVVAAGTGTGTMKLGGQWTDTRRAMGRLLRCDPRRPPESSPHSPGGSSSASNIVRRIVRAGACNALRKHSGTTSAYWRRLGVFASVALATLWTTSCGGGGGGPSPVEPEASNRPPAAVGTIPARTLTAGETASVGVASYFNDPDGDPLTYGASTSSASVASVSVSGATLTIVGVAAGSATVTVTASDPDGLSAHQSAAVTVESANQGPEPVGSIPNQTITAGQTVTIDAAQYFNDPDGNPLTYAATTTNVAIAAVSMSGSTLTIVGVAAGSATVTVTASDPDGLSAHQSTAVTVESANQGPEAVGSIPNQTITAGQTVTIDAAQYFNDPDGNPLTYAATTTNVAIAAVSMSGSTLTIVGVAAGSATVTVTASDPDGLSAHQSTAVTVESANQGPEAVGSIPNQTITAGQTVTIDAAQYFNDPDGNPLTYAATTTNVAIAAVSMSGSTLTIVGVAAGSATVTVTASDPDGLSAMRSAAVTVSRTNQGPEAVGSIPDQTIGAGQTVTIDASLYFSDPDGDVLTYDATTSSIAVVVASVSGSTLTIGGVGPGTATMTVTASDPGGLSAMQNIKVNVGVRSRDREALVALYEATQGDFFWDIDTNWLSDRPVGTWYGVTTDDDGRVVELSLPSNTVWGPIPREIVHLQSLKRLDLSDNRLDGALPPEIGDLRDLEELNLSENTFLGSLSSIPAALGKLAKLQWLNLSGTGFKDAIPRELGNLQSLARLEFVDMTWLSGPIPPEFGQLGNLRHLDVSQSGRLEGALPQELISVPLALFHWNRTDLCAPGNQEFQAWLRGIADHQGGASCR